MMATRAVIAGIVVLTAGLAAAALLGLNDQTTSPDRAVERFVLAAAHRDTGMMLEITHSSVAGSDGLQERYGQLSSWIEGCGGLTQLATTEYRVRRNEVAEATIHVGFQRCAEDRVTFALRRDEAYWRVLGMVAR